MCCQGGWKKKARQKREKKTNAVGRLRVDHRHWSAAAIQHQFLCDDGDEKFSAGSLCLKEKKKEKRLRCGQIVI